MSRDDYWDDDDRPSRLRPLRWDEDDDPRPPRRTLSAGVTSLAILNLITGVLVLVLGACGTLVFGFLQGSRIDPPGLPGLGGSVTVTLVQILFIFFWGIGSIITSIGLFCRGGWARMLSLILGGFAATAGSLYLVSAIMTLTDAEGGDQKVQSVFSLIGTVFFLAYFVCTYWVLLHPRRAAEFQ